MNPADVNARLARLKLQAAMIRAKFSESIPTLALRIEPDDDLEALLSAVREICGAAGAANGPQFGSIHGQQTPTHVVVPAELVETPDDVVGALAAMRSTVESMGGPPFGWMIAVDRSDPQVPGLVMRLTIGTERQRRPKINTYSGVISDALGVSVMLEVGALAKQHVKQLWPFVQHKNFATGMSIGSGGSRRGTLAMPVRVLDRPLGRFFLTVGHLLPDPPAERYIQQPWDNAARNRRIGVADRVEYQSAFDAVNYFDAALINAGMHPVSLQFGPGQKYELVGAHRSDLRQGDIAYICGASTGLQAVRVQYTDVETTMLSTHGVRLIYRDVIEFSHDIDNTKPASVPGDSGAPLLVRTAQGYSVAGLVIGGGSQTGGSGQARSYAVPIGRILDHFQAEPF